MKVHIIVTDDKGKEYEGEIDLIETKSVSQASRKVVRTSLSKVPNKIVELIAKNLDELKIPALVLIALKFHASLTKSRQEEILESWGKKVGGNLRGGNYQRDLVGKGLIHDIGKYDGEYVYQLTAKGKIEVDKIIKQLGIGKIGKK